MSEEIIHQVPPGRFLRLVVRVAPYYCWFHLFIALIGVRRWFEGKSDLWEVGYMVGFTIIYFGYARRLQRTYGPKKAATEARDPA